jgi:hypothetical protein
MPKLPNTTDKFNFYWYERGNVTVRPANIKEILDELMRQYADHVFNLFGTQEPESLNAKHNLELLAMVKDELKVIE